MNVIRAEPTRENSCFSSCRGVMRVPAIHPNTPPAAHRRTFNVLAVSWRQLNGHVDRVTQNRRPHPYLERSFAFMTNPVASQARLRRSFVYSA